MTFMNFYDYQNIFVNESEIYRKLTWFMLNKKR